MLDHATHPLTQQSPYSGYTYAYPHKTAYTAIPPRSLKHVWQAEPSTTAYLYLHVPFCEMRCGFCNLFTFAQPRESVVSAYLEAIERQSHAHRMAIEQRTISRFAMGGGTPTYLDAAALRQLLTVANLWANGQLHTVPSSVETSPSTATEDRLAVLAEFQISRISIGIQSFLEAETHAIARPQLNRETHEAIRRVRSFSFPTLNLDLIYGLPEQTVASWLRSIETALRYQPEELFLYPLYVRPLTSLGKSRRSWDDLRLECYREAKAMLHAAGYRQQSMRMFVAPHAPPEEGPAYCIQQDAMLGLGCGARSYTADLHYSQGYAVARKNVGQLIEQYNQQSIAEFSQVQHGFILDASEQRRRYLLLGLLQEAGVSVSAYQAYFGTSIHDDFPQLLQLSELDWLTISAERYQLTEAGMERSDVIGPWLYSTVVRERMDVYEWH